MSSGPVHAQSQIRGESECWYSCGSFKVKITLDGMVRSGALLDSEAEINMMNRWLMIMIGISMRPGPRLDFPPSLNCLEKSISSLDMVDNPPS